MATSARNAVVSVNAFNLSGFFRAVEAAWEIDLEDTTGFGVTRVAKSWCLLLEVATLVFTGFWDATAVTGVNAVLKAAFAAAGKSIVSWWPTGDAYGAVGVAMHADLSTKKREGAVDKAITIGAEFKSSVGEEEVVCHHPMQLETIDANGTTVDNLASTANGGSAYLEVEDVTTNIIVTVRHSTDNFGGSDVLLGTFTTVTVDRTCLRIEFPAGTTINRYTRFVWDLTGNAIFRGSLHRRP